MRRPGEGQSEENQDPDDPTLIRVPRPDEGPADDPEERDDAEDPAEDSDRD